MTSIPSTGPVSFSDVKTMLGISTYNMNSFRIPSGTYTPGTNIPTGSSTTINMDIFHGKTRAGCSQWSTKMGTTTFDNIYGSKTDSSGNIIVCGTFNGTTFTLYNQPGTTAAATLARIGSGDIFVAKYTSAGNVVWAARAGSTANDTGFQLDIDSSNNIYVGGGFRATMTIYNSNGTSAATLVPVGTGDSAHIIKYDTNGNYVWALRCGTAGTINTNLYGLVVDSTGSIIATGPMNGACGIYNSSASGAGLAATLSQIGGQDVWIAKWNSSGLYQWSTRCGGLTGTDTENIFRLTVDSTNSVFIPISYGSALNVYNANGTLWGTIALISTAQDVCLIKYSSAGAVSWAIKGGSASSDIICGAVCDKVDDSVYFSFSGSNPSSVYNASGVLSATLLGGAYIIKYNSAGAFLWAVRMWTTSSTLVFCMALTPNREVVVFGNYNGGPSSVALTFYNTAGTSVDTKASATYNQLFIAKYDSSGTYKYSSLITSTAVGLGIADLDCSSSIAQTLVGGYSATSLPTFNTPSGVASSSQTSIGSTDIFLCRYVF